MMSLVPLQQRHANHSFVADILELHPPGTVELARFSKLVLANLTRGPPKITPRHLTVARRLASQLRAHNEAYASARAPTTTFTKEA